MEFSLKIFMTVMLTFSILCLKPTKAYSSTVMSIDIGSEWMKVATASIVDGILPTNVLIEIALNNISKRKTPTAVAFHNDERTFGEEALTECSYNPSNCYIYFLDLLGKKIDNPVVDLFKERFPYYNIIPDPVKNTVLFNHEELGEQFSPEELVAMMLEKAREYAQVSTGQVINEAVISVPGYFGQAERFAMFSAAEIVGIKVLQLINSYTATALNYGLSLIKKSNIMNPVYLMFYDMGAYSTQASIVSYQLIKSKNNEGHQPQLTVLGVGYERNLGGLEIQLHLRDYLAAKFNDLKLTTNDVTKNTRSMAKLFIESGRLKNILSVNTDHFAQVRNLIDDKDMLIKVTRKELEQLCENVFNKVVLPAQRALKASGLTIEDIEQVMLVGAGTRVPQVQERLVKDFKSDQPLGKLLNTDEAAALGAAYKAADISNGFKIKTFITKDATLFPIQLIINDKAEVQVKRTLFGYMSPYPQHKIIKFHEHLQDFNLTVAYTELSHLDTNEIKCLGSLSLEHIYFERLQDAYYNKYQNEKSVDSITLITNCVFNESGILKLENFKLLVEESIIKRIKENVLSAVSEIINLFNGPKSLLKDTNLTPERTDNSIVSFPNTKYVNLPNTEETIAIHSTHLFALPAQGKDLLTSTIKLKKLKDKDVARIHKENSLNNLLTLIVEIRENLEKSEFADAATNEEMRSILDKCSEVADWLGYDGLDSEAEEYDNTYNDLKKLIKPVWERSFEHLERPTKLEALNNALNNSSIFLEKIKNIYKDTPFTQTEIYNLDQLISETASWRNHLVEEQNKLPKYVDPILKTQAIEKKLATIEREMRYLMYKFNSWKSGIKSQHYNSKDSAQRKEFSIGFMWTICCFFIIILFFVCSISFLRRKKSPKVLSTTS